MKTLQQQLFKLMSRELSHLSIINLHTNAEQRVIKFLLNLSERLQRRGLSATQFYLSMSREEMSLYLGLAAETVSRIFKKLQNEKLILVKNRQIELSDVLALKHLEQGI